MKQKLIPRMRPKLRSVAEFHAAVAGKRRMLSAEDVFASPACQRVIYQIAKTAIRVASRKLKHKQPINDRLRLRILFAPGDTDGFTNGDLICVNAGGEIAEYAADLKQRYVLVLGLLAHELSHWFFCDFAEANQYLNQLQYLESTPEMNGNPELNDAHLDMQQFISEHPEKAGIMQDIAKDIYNILLDGKNERQFYTAFPGMLANALQYMSIRTSSETNFGDEISNADNAEASAAKQYLAVRNLLLLYSLTGSLSVSKPEHYSHPIYRKIMQINPYIMDFQYERTTSGDAVTNLLCCLWIGYIRPYLEETEDSKDPGKENLPKSFIRSSAFPIGSGKAKVSFPTGSEKNEHPEHEEPFNLCDDTKGEITEDELYEQVLRESSFGKLLDEIAENKFYEAEETQLLESFDNDPAVVEVKALHAHRGKDICLHRQMVSPEMKELYETFAAPYQMLAEKAATKLLPFIRRENKPLMQKRQYMGQQFDAGGIYRMDLRNFRRKRNLLPTPELAIAISVDESGSMSSVAFENTTIHRYEIARAAAIFFREVAEKIGAPLMILGDTESFETQKCEFFSYADFWHPTKEDAYRIMGIKPRDCNRDGAAIKYCLEKLREYPSDIKLFIRISDGLPSADGYYGKEAAEDIRNIITYYEKKHHIHCFAAGIGPDAPQICEIYGAQRFMDISDLSNMPEILTRLIRKHIAKR